MEESDCGCVRIESPTKRVRQKIYELTNLINELVPEGPERDTAIKSAEGADYWTTQAFARIEERKQFKEEANNET